MILRRLEEDYDRLRFEWPFTSTGPQSLEDYVLNTYGISLASTYGSLPIKNPFGKASGQLSLNENQIRNDAEAGLGFTVLKTVIASDVAGDQSMAAWAIPATHMSVERIRGTRPNVRDQEGWTVTWKGRGWSGSFPEYLDFFRSSLEIGREHNLLVVPSVKYHLPKPGEHKWREPEYVFTTNKLLDIWNSPEPMPLEKDFSPTLAGDENFSSQEHTILEWLKEVPRLIRKAADGRPVDLGLKLFNAQREDSFQLKMLEVVNALPENVRPDFVIYANRLFDPARSYEGTKGVAFGGPDLSDRNLSVMRRWKQLCTNPIRISASGNILTGKGAFEYLKLGATSFQMHTLFQLPDSEFDRTSGSRSVRGLHRLLFHPEHGFLRHTLELKRELGLRQGVTITELARACQLATL